MALVACAGLMGCKNDAPGTEQATAETENTPVEFGVYDILAQLRDRGWEITEEEVKSDPRDAEGEILYFTAGKVLFCGLFNREDPEDPSSSYDFIQVGGYSVFCGSLFTTSEGWEDACADESLGAICDLPFEQKMLQVKDWQKQFLADAEAVILELSQN